MFECRAHAADSETVSFYRAVHVQHIHNAIYAMARYLPVTSQHSVKTSEQIQVVVGIEATFGLSYGFLKGILLSSDFELMLRDVNVTRVVNLV